MTVRSKGCDSGLRSSTGPSPDTRTDVRYVPLRQGPDTVAGYPVASGMVRDTASRPIGEYSPVERRRRQCEGDQMRQRAAVVLTAQCLRQLPADSPIPSMMPTNLARSR